MAGTGEAGFSGDELDPRQAKLNFPSGVAVGGSLYIADRHNHRIRKVASCGDRGPCITTVAGTGVAGFSGDGGPATAAQLNLPSGVAVDAAGNLYIADFNNHRIRKVDNVTGAITTVAGNGVFGGGGDGGPATEASLWNPKGIAWSPGNLYIADEMNQKVRRVDLVTGNISTLIGTGVAGSLPTQLNGPLGVAADQFGNVYIADTGNDRIQLVSEGKITTLCKGALRSPAGVAVDGFGNVTIADTGHHQIRQIVVEGQCPPVAGTGTAGFSGDGGSPTSAQLSSPTGVAVDAGGENVFIADLRNQRIRKVAPIVIK